MSPTKRRPARPTLALLVALAAARMPAAAEPRAASAAPADAPEFLHLDRHPPVPAPDAGWVADADLQRRLDRALDSLELGSLVAERRLAVTLVDVADPTAPRHAASNGDEMMYAASVPKIGVLYAAFQARREGRLRIDEGLERTLTDMIRVSSNQAASRAIRTLGFEYINAVLWKSKLYEPRKGGIWVGKAYGGENDQWHRDPVANKSHGATTNAVARLLVLLAEERLVDPEASREMLAILGDPGIHHKFVRGLDARPGSVIYRKSGSWRKWHGDAALVERGAKRYVAVALCEDEGGSAILERLIVALDDIVDEPGAPGGPGLATPR